MNTLRESTQRAYDALTAGLPAGSAIAWATTGPVGDLTFLVGPATATADNPTACGSPWDPVEVSVYVVLPGGETADAVPTLDTAADAAVAALSAAGLPVATVEPATYGNPPGPCYTLTVRIR